jgi:hypothetical protein
MLLSIPGCERLGGTESGDRSTIIEIVLSETELDHENSKLWTTLQMSLSSTVSTVVLQFSRIIAENSRAYLLESNSLSTVAKLKISIDYMFC